MTGSGMGLALVYGTVKHHDGCVAVSSTLGGGSSFCLYLPCIETDHQEVVENELTDFAPVEAKIFVVDDEALFREMNSDMLNGVGYSLKPRRVAKKWLSTLRRIARMLM